ncbi:NAD(P)-dependent oxidoreductase [Ktedonobacter sp. SOSP1-52]|nr:SDR family oxidoreductase [Ktedonobacter sp. SOSP1-52]GHO65439.1 NAD(P)-dependent oxidoreductase [Ktedonobacter sp. SOSP1-52]
MDFATAPEEVITHCLDSVRPLAVIHCAAWVDVNGCEQEPQLAYSINTHVTQLLAQTCAHANIHFVFISTEYVFDGMLPPGQTYREHDPRHPLNYYGISKGLAEMAVEAAYSSSFAPWTICRTAVLYGSTWQSRPDFPQWLCTKLKQGEVVHIAKDLISSPTHAVNLANMLVSVVQRRLRGIYHTVGRTTLDRYQFALLVAHFYDLDAHLIHPIEAAELGVTRPLNVGLCTTKISHDIGRQPWSVEEGLAYSRQMEVEEPLESNSFA